MNLNQEHPSKNWGCYNFSHRNTRVTKLWSHDHIYNMISFTSENCVGHVVDNNYNAITFISKLPLILDLPGVVKFAGIIKITTIIIKKTFKDSKKLKELEIMH